MTYRVLTINEKEEWSRLLEKLPVDQQDIYYTPDYYKLYERNGDGTAMCFVYRSVDDIANTWTIPSDYEDYDPPNTASVRRNIQVIVDELEG